MKYNILVGGAAGQGMDTLSTLLERILKRKGYFIHSTKDYMSRVRGGHNFIQVRFGTEPVYSHWPVLDLIIALDKNTVDLHIDRLGESGVILCDESIEVKDGRVLHIPAARILKEVDNNRASGSAVIGAALKVMGESTDLA
ncbi:MAG: 2-oxoacid:acceptor oxidoreductase family protein [Pseudomonadota bacterium]